MTPEALLSHLESLGITLTTENGRLRLNSPRGTINETLKSVITALKSPLVTLLEQRASMASSGIVAVDRSAPLRVSGFQQRLWILQRIDGESAAYNSAHVWATPDPATVDDVVRSIRSLLARHEILRSSFDAAADEIVVIPRAVSDVPIEIRDFDGPSDEEQLTTLRSHLDSEVRKPFDLASAPPVRFVVYHRSNRSPATMMIAHHIAVDDWSLQLVKRELIRGAEPLPAGALLSPETPPRLQFLDFAAWQRALEGSQQLLSDAKWWETYLAGAPQLSAFPIDRGEVTNAQGAVFAVEWPRDFADRLRSVVLAERATVFMAMIAACAVVLRWHTGQTDVVFGIPSGDREHTECEEMIGPFVSLRLVRMDVSGDPTFAELLGRAREAALETHDHRHVPFEVLLERLQAPRNPERSPLFQIALVHQNARSTERRSPQSGANVKDRGSLQAAGGAMHELTWFLRESEAGIQCTFEYRPDLFCAQAIEKIAYHLEVVLRRGADDAKRRYRELCILSDVERQRLIGDFNSTHFEFGAAEFLAEFERRAAVEPDRVAVVSEDDELTYGELNRLSNRIAHCLSSHGARRGTLVGIYLPRDSTLLACLLAVQKTGAAYVPLDPNFPAERLKFMLRDSGAAFLMTSGHLPPAPELPPEVAAIDVSSLGGFSSWPESSLNSALELGDVAYLIYTSGSTGVPKGVAVSRANLNNLLSSMAREPGLSRSDRFAAITTISFDIAGLELFLPLFVGASIDLVSRETAGDGQALAERLRLGGATVLQATPATWRLLIDADWRGPEGFRAFSGGEALAPDLAERLLTRVGELWNLYGPTETTIWSTVDRVRQSAQITVGRPIANTRIYIVGNAGELVPAETPGEIWIAGAGVALGYHNRPELSAERFVADPFTLEPGSRAYRTGDLGRWLRDGRIEHLGRLDNQVKIRGYRIELGEIETSLSALPEVHHAVVVAREVGPGDRRLVAYINFNVGSDLTVSEVRRALRQRLPDYMIPSLVVTVDAIPLTPNGKVDRAALPDPFTQVPSAGAEFVAPADGPERVVAEIWTDILKVERVGANDNFFELGGHSLLSLRVAAAVQQRLGWRMDPRILFFQTLSQIAAAATEAHAKIGRQA